MRILGCVLALAVAWPVASTASPIEVVNPHKADWEFKPSGDAVSAVFPPLAMALGLEASTTMHCAVDRLGVLHECKVVELIGPKGLGFEAASLSLASMFRLRPDRTATGRGRNGGASIPLAFRLPVLKNQLPAVEPAPAPGLLPLAREQVSRFVVGEQLDQGFQYANKRLAESVASSVEPATMEEIMADIRVAQAKVRTEVLEFQAHLLAANLTQQQIEASLNYDKTSGAQALRKASDTMRHQAEKSFTEKRVWMLIAAHREFCSDHDCKGSSEGDPPPASPPWIQEPSQKQVEAAGPKLAMFLLVGGYADLDCASTEFGVLANCQVVQEKPPALGFGASALAVAGYYRRPPGLRGERTPLRVAYPFPDVSMLNPPKVSHQQGPKIALALEVLEAEGRAVTLERQAAHLVDEVNNANFPGVPDTTRAEALAVAQRRLRAVGEDAIFEAAEQYAEILTEDELKARLAYMKGPDNAALTAMTEKMAKTYQDLSEIIYAQVTHEAGRLWCAKHDCPKLPPYRGPSTAADPLPLVRP